MCFLTLKWFLARSTTMEYHEDPMNATVELPPMLPNDGEPDAKRQRLDDPLGDGSGQEHLQQVILLAAGVAVSRSRDYAFVNICGGVAPAVLRSLWLSAADEFGDLSSLQHVDQAQLNQQAQLEQQHYEQQQAQLAAAHAQQQQELHQLQEGDQTDPISTLLAAGAAAGDGVAAEQQGGEADMDPNQVRLIIVCIGRDMARKLLTGSHSGDDHLCCCFAVSLVCFT